jgi:hypothetical protein
MDGFADKNIGHLGSKECKIMCIWVILSQNMDNGSPKQMQKVIADSISDSNT